MNYRIEKDTMGEVRVPAGKYWGAQTQRSLMNFPIGPAASMPVEVIHAFGYLKKAAAMANNKFGLLSAEKMEVISRVCDEIIAGELDDHFPLVIWQTGSGTHTNMNCNEVIANRAHVLPDNKPGEGERLIHPNDIRLLASGPRTGIGEIIIPANEPGSSIMPGKVNPTQAEAMTMVCAQIMGNDTTISIAGSNGHLELNVFKPVMINAFLQSATLLADAAMAFNDNCIAGIEPNLKRIPEHLNNSLMLATALSNHIGYGNTAEIVREAFTSDITLKEAALKLNLLTEQQFDEWVDPAKMIHPDRYGVR
ncbi:MAG: hypothetical protein K0B05_13830 [Bacteroidales bacterium]|nr:hypothetical protein [Bacteroidales bacterium]